MFTQHLYIHCYTHIIKFNWVVIISSLKKKKKIAQKCKGFFQLFIKYNTGMLFVIRINVGEGYLKKN